MAAKKDTRGAQYRQILIIAPDPSPQAPPEPEALKIIDHWKLLSKSNNEQAEWVMLPKPKSFTVKFDKGRWHALR